MFLYCARIKRTTISVALVIEEECQQLTATTIGTIRAICMMSAETDTLSFRRFMLMSSGCRVLRSVVQIQHILVTDWERNSLLLAS